MLSVWSPLLLCACRLGRLGYRCSCVSRSFIDRSQDPAWSVLPAGCWLRPYSWYLDAISRSSLSSKGMGTLGTEASKQICSIQTDKFSRPKDAYELFNLRRSSARNVIERIFGIIKLRFKILERGCNFNIQLQAAVVLALCALHNSIREYDSTDLVVSDPYPSDYWISRGLLAPECYVQHADDPGELTALTAFEAEEREAMIAKRESMAQGMWDSYCVLTLRR